MAETADAPSGEYTLLEFAEEAAISETEVEELRANLAEANEAYHEPVEGEL